MIGKTGGTANTVSRRLAPQVQRSSNAAHGFGALFRTATADRPPAARPPAQRPPIRPHPTDRHDSYLPGRTAPRGTEIPDPSRRFHLPLSIVHSLGLP